EGRGGLALDAWHHEDTGASCETLALRDEGGHRRLGERAGVLAHQDEVEPACPGGLGDLDQIVAAVVRPARVDVGHAAEDHAARLRPSARARVSRHPRRPGAGSSGTQLNEALQGWRMVGACPTVARRMPRPPIITLRKCLSSATASRATTPAG